MEKDKKYWSKRGKLAGQKKLKEILKQTRKECSGKYDHTYEGPYEVDVETGKKMAE